MKALGELYDQLAPRLSGMLSYILRSRSLAGEVLEDVFLSLWSEARTLSQAGGSASAWLVVRARHMALDRLCRGREQRARAGKSPASPPPAKFPEGKSFHPKSILSAFLAARPLAWVPRPEEIARVDARLGLLQKIVRQMPKPQGEALDLAVFRGFSEAEIVQELGEPLAKVRAGLRAAITFLRHRRRAVVGTWAANI
jgi:RNA polymerase sigma-70 factor (ECF subfamily)